MSKFLKSILRVLPICLLSFTLSAQARLTINNNSMRSMTVKVMQVLVNQSEIYKMVTIAPNSSETVYFSESGYYFTKTKAVLKGKDPVYRKGQQFEVTNDASGYSILTLSFSIVESSVPQASGGKRISKSEFDKN